MDSTHEKIYEEYIKTVYNTDELPQNKKVLVSFIEMQKNIITNAVNTILQLSNDPDIVTQLTNVSTKEKLDFVKVQIGDIIITLRTNGVLDNFLVSHHFENTIICNDLINNKNQ